MNHVSIFLLKCLRHGYARLFSTPTKERYPVIGIEESNDLIYNTLSSNEPCMIARYGATELTCILNYLAIQKQDKNIIKYIKGETGDWWWNIKIMEQMQRWSGFFPPSEDNLTRFSEEMLRDSCDMDILAVFQDTIRGVPSVKPYLKNDIKFIPLVSLDSFLFNMPWTRCLKGRKILIVHPYAKLIEMQYTKREILFPNPEVLPAFELRTVEAVQSLGGVNHGFKDWFEALEWMKNEMDKAPYDIALIGCGAYGLPLAAHAKRTGHMAVHIGGSLQLLFGIKGKRWEEPYMAAHYKMPPNSYIDIMNNPNWVRPYQYITEEIKNVEGGCYL